MGIFSEWFRWRRRGAAPPVPAWRPAVELPLERIMECVQRYTGHRKDFVMFRHGTCVLVPDDMDDQDAIRDAMATLAGILGFHPDVDPRMMEDGNILIFYNQPACTVVLEDIAENHMEMIRKNHVKGLVRDEVVMTPAGPNTFDDFGMKVLFGRSQFFMDATGPEVRRIVRRQA